MSCQLLRSSGSWKRQGRRGGQVSRTIRTTSISRRENRQPFAFAAFYQFLEIHCNTTSGFVSITETFESTNSLLIDTWVGLFENVLFSFGCPSEQLKKQEQQSCLFFFFFLVKIVKVNNSVSLWFFLPPGNWRKCYLSVAGKQRARLSERGRVLWYGSC